MFYRNNSNLKEAPEDTLSELVGDFKAGQLMDEMERKLVDKYQDDEPLNEKAMEQGVRVEITNIHPGDFGGYGSASRRYGFLVTGGTFAIKDKLKKLGLRWDSGRNGWSMEHGHSEASGKSWGIAEKKVKQALKKVQDLVKVHNAEVEKRNQEKFAGAGLSDELGGPKTMKQMVKDLSSVTRANNNLAKHGVQIIYDFPSKTLGGAFGAFDIYIVGNTYPIKDLLNKFGFQFVKSVPASVRTDAKDLMGQVKRMGGRPTKVTIGWKMDGATYDRIQKQVQHELVKAFEMASEKPKKDVVTVTPKGAKVSGKTAYRIPVPGQLRAEDLQHQDVLDFISDNLDDDDVLEFVESVEDLDLWSLIDEAMALGITSYDVPSPTSKPSRLYKKGELKNDMKIGIWTVSKSSPTRVTVYVEHKPEKTMFGYSMPVAPTSLTYTWDGTGYTRQGQYLHTDGIHELAGGGKPDSKEKYPKGTIIQGGRYKFVVTGGPIKSKYSDDLVYYKAKKAKGNKELEISIDGRGWVDVFDGKKRFSLPNPVNVYLSEGVELEGEELEEGIGWSKDSSLQGSGSKGAMGFAGGDYDEAWKTSMGGVELRVRKMTPFDPDLPERNPWVWVVYPEKDGEKSRKAIAGEGVSSKERARQLAMRTAERLANQLREEEGLFDEAWRGNWAGVTTIQINGDPGNVARVLQHPDLEDYYPGINAKEVKRHFIEMVKHLGKSFKGKGSTFKVSNVDLDRSGKVEISWEQVKGKADDDDSVIDAAEEAIFGRGGRFGRGLVSAVADRDELYAALIYGHPYEGNAPKLVGTDVLDEPFTYGEDVGDDLDARLRALEEAMAAGMS